MIHLSSPFKHDRRFVIRITVTCYACDAIAGMLVPSNDHDQITAAIETLTLGESRYICSDCKKVGKRPDRTHHPL